VKAAKKFGPSKEKGLERRFREGADGGYQDPESPKINTPNPGRKGGL